MNRNAMVLTRFPMAEVRFVAIVVFIFVYLAVLGGCSKPYHPPESFGVPNHQPLDDQELKAALSRAKQLASLGQFDDPDFQNILARLSPHFPVVPVMVGRQPEPWTRIQLNSTGAEFGAIRFSSPLKVPANLWVAVAYESRTLLGLGIRQCGAKSEVSGAGSALFKQGLALEGVDLPDKNTMIQFVRGGINAFLGAWDITKRYGAVTSTIDRWVIREGEDGIVGSYRSTKFENSPFPFVICRGVSDRVETRRYFLWLFGFEQLLLERQLDHTSEWEEHLNDNQVSSIEAVRAQNLLLDYVLE